MGKEFGGMEEGKPRQPVIKVEEGQLEAWVLFSGGQGRAAIGQMASTREPGYDRKGLASSHRVDLAANPARRQRSNPNLR